MHRSSTTPRGKQTLWFIAVAAGVYLAALGLMLLMVRLAPEAKSDREAVFPPVFWVTTVLLLAGSIDMQRAVRSVRREKQVPFRRALLRALVWGTAFVGVQTYGLRSMIQQQDPEEVQTGANAFLVMLAGLHGLHFTLALMLLIWVTLGALADRYDHEYYLGVAVCAWFWHALGIVWGLVLIVFLIATQ
ncbi:MAG: heme-copper oxidase subunit III [Planctomycetales bacterium]